MRIEVLLLFTSIQTSNTSNDIEDGRIHISNKDIEHMKKETVERIHKFINDRDWSKFHSPSNLAKSISIEANELLECFQWSDDEYNLEHVKEELADVMIYCRDLLDRLNLDEDEIINNKMDKNEKKYPIEKAKGNSTKYTDL